LRVYLLIFIFFFVPRPAPTSTLFPYTTLFRSVDGEVVHHAATGRRPGSSSSSVAMYASSTGSSPSRLFIRCAKWNASSAGLSSRSEEHTSELQSLAYLVCRLLLEKKKHISDYV